jgi:UDP-glucose:(heptosyl)LPS alpha-1,3-glucosyltransferase
MKRCKITSEAFPRKPPPAALANPKRFAKSAGMKIGLVRRGFSRTGGAESYLKRLGRTLSDAGHQATLYSTEDWPAAEWPYGPLVHLIASSPLRFATAVQEARRPDQVLLSLDRILQCDCYRAGDGVHKLWLKRRMAHEPRWRAFFRFANRKHAQLLELERTLFEKGGARHVVANSRMVQKEITVEFAYPQDKITVIYNGLPAFRSTGKPGSRAEVRRAWSLRKNDVGLLFAGSGWDRKGLKYAVQAVERISNPNVRLLVAGIGKQQTYRSNKVQFLGPVVDMQSIFLAADMFILPTVYDPFSNACLEALSFGLPVITTATNGFAEIMESGVHGEVIDPAENVPALQQAIEKWLDPGRRESARKRCIDLARGYTIERNVEQTLDVLEKLG